MFNIPMSPFPEGAQKNGLETHKSEGALAVETEAHSSLGKGGNSAAKSLERDGTEELNFGPVYEEAQDHQPRYSQNNAPISDIGKTALGPPMQPAGAIPEASQSDRSPSFQTGLYTRIETVDGVPESAPDVGSISRDQGEIAPAVAAQASQHQTRSTTAQKTTLIGAALTNTETTQKTAQRQGGDVTLSDQNEKAAFAPLPSEKPTRDSTQMPRGNDVSAAGKKAHNDAVLRAQTLTVPDQSISENRAADGGSQPEELDAWQRQAAAPSEKISPPSEQAPRFMTPANAAAATPDQAVAEHSQKLQKTDAFLTRQPNDGVDYTPQNFGASGADAAPARDTVTVGPSASETPSNRYSHATRHEQRPNDMPAAAAREFASVQPPQSATTGQITPATAPLHQPDRADTNLSTAPASSVPAASQATAAPGAQQTVQNAQIFANAHNEKTPATRPHFQSDAMMQDEVYADTQHAQLSRTSNTSQEAPLKRAAQTSNAAAPLPAEGTPLAVSGAADPAQTLPEIVEELGLNSAIDETRGDNTANRTTQPQRADAPIRPVVQIAEAARQLSDKPIEIALSPEELGKVRLSLQMTEGQSLQIVVAAERAETLELLRRNIDSLMNEFKELGYENNGFSFQSFDQNADGDQGTFSQEEGHPHATTAQNSERPAPSNDDVSRITLGAGRGIDIRL